MNPRVVAVTPIADHVLEITFSNREKKRFDVTPYLGLGLFSELRDHDLFATAKAEMGTVTWANGLDICPDTLYLEGR